MGYALVGTVRTITIEIPDGKSDGWCLVSAKHHPQQSQNSQPYRPDSFTDEVSFE